MRGGPAVVRWWTTCSVIVLVAGVAASMLPRSNAVSANKAKAQELYYSGLTAMQAGQYGPAATLFRDAWAVDPARLGGLISLSVRGPESYSATLLHSIDSIALASGDSLLLRCARAMLSHVVHDTTVRAIERSEHSLSRRCGTILRALYLDPPDAMRVWPQYADVPYVVATRAAALIGQDPAAAWTFARQTATSGAHPMVRVMGYIYGGNALHKLGQHARAADWEREAERRAREWGAGAWFQYLGHLQTHGGLLDETDATDSVAAHIHATTQRAFAETADLYPRLDFGARASLLWATGAEFLRVGNFKEALADFTSLVQLADSAQDRGLAANAYGRQGRTLVKLGRMREAERALLRARELGLAAGNPWSLREASHDLLHLHEALGRYDAAVAAGREFARYSEELDTRPTRMMAHHDLGWVFRRHGRLIEADRAFQTMIAEIDTLHTHYYWAGEYYEHIGRLERARDYYLREEAGAGERARMRTGLARVSEALGETENAKRVAYIADRDTGTWFPEYVPLLPGILARSGRIEEARTRYRLERAAAQARGKTQALSQLALESAELERVLGNAALARTLADTAAVAAQLAGATELEMRARALSAVAALESGVAPRVSVASLDSAVRKGERMRIPQLSAELQLLRGDAIRRLGDTKSALASYGRAAAWVDSIAEHIESDPARAGHRATHVRVSDRALSALIHDIAYPNRIAQYSVWSARRKRRSGARAPARVSAADAVDVSGARRDLDADAAIVDYVVLDTVVAALVVTSRDGALHRLPVTADSLRARIARFLIPIAPAVGSAIDVTRIGFDSATARQLYRDLIEPIRWQLAGIRKLNVVPDGPLHMVPFDALLHPASEPRFLIDDFTIRYVTSLAAGGAGGSARSAVFTRGPALAVRGPNDETMGAAEEIAAVASSLRSNVTVLDSVHATEEAIRAQSRGAAILHFATHAEANDVNPDFARLAVAPSANDDGWLQAFEIRTWRLNGALVVLSACQTAAGRLAAGEGTLSLSRAFLQAGAGATVATLWPVGAPTAVLMRAFYDQLSSGADVDDALRTARLTLRESGYSHPFYWAPFILTTRQL